jgi:hypothetical protein
VNATVLAAFPAVLDPDPAGFAPPADYSPCDELSVYVTWELVADRPLFDILGDPFVLERADEYISVLDHLARDPAIREALARQGRPGPSHRYSLAA